VLEKPSDAELAYGIESKPLACGSCSKLTLWQTDGIKDVPAAVYILMALEAARQLRSSAEADDGLSLQLTNIVFYERLSLKLFATPDASLEVQLTSRKMGDTHNYQFDIFFQTPETPCKWTKHCSGILGGRISSGYMSPAIWEASHDSTLFDKSLALHNHVTLNAECRSVEPPRFEWNLRWLNG